MSTFDRLNNANQTLAKVEKIFEKFPPNNDETLNKIQNDEKNPESVNFF